MVIVGREASGELPNVVYSVAGRARRIASGSPDAADAPALARARVQGASGRWLLVHGSALEGDESGRIAVVIEPAQPPEIAPLIVAAYGLSQRERQIVELAVRGLSTKDIAGSLFLSPYTVQDYLKSVFEKVGVRSRRELVSRLFFEHYAPHMGRADNLGANGFFAGTVAL